MDFLINLDVDDLGLAERFYSEAFGLRPARRLGNSGLEMLGGPARLWLLLKPAGTPASGTMGDTRRYGRHWTPVHLDFVTEDIDAAVARALAAGAVLEQPVSTHARYRAPGIAEQDETDGFWCVARREEEA